MKEVTIAYVQLQELKKYEDSLILNLIYSLGANPETIVLITYDLIHEEGNLNTLMLYNLTLFKQSWVIIWDIILFRDMSPNKKKKHKVEYKAIKKK